MTRRAAALVLVGLVLVSLNLRPAAVTVGPVLSELRAALGMGPALAGVLTSLPVLAFAVFGAAAPAVARRVGLHRTVLAALLLVVAGLAVRAVVGSSAPFLVWSLVALAGMAAANVLLPSLVKRHFPERTGTVTAVYTTALAVGLTAALVLTVPLGEGLAAATGAEGPDDPEAWRWGLGAWAVLAAVAALPWLALVAHDRAPDDGAGRVGLRDVARTPLGRRMAVFFGLQSLQAYAVFGWFAQLWRDAGFSATEAGLLVGVVAAVSIPLSLWLPAAAARREDQRGILLAVMVCYPLGYAGLAVAPAAGAVLWAVLVGIGACTFPLILVLLGLRSRTPEGTAALSGFTQSVGYLLAAVGPFAVGALYGATGGWTVPLALLGALTVPQLLLGLAVARPSYVEDQLGR